VSGEWLVVSKQFSIYPNPAKDFALIHFASKSDVFITIYTMDGRIVPASIFKQDSNSYQLDTHLLSNGIYIVEAKTVNGKSVQKLVINK